MLLSDRGQTLQGASDTWSMEGCYRTMDRTKLL